MANNTTHTQGQMPGKFFGFEFTINPLVGFGSGGVDKYHMAAALDTFAELVAGDKVTVLDDQAIAACEFLAKFLREEC